MSEFLDIVNEHDHVIGQSSFKEAHDKLLRHRFCRIFVFDQNNKIVLHKRKWSHPDYPMVWDSAGGHVHAGESYEQAAHRELNEEMGLTGHILQEVGNIYFNNPDFQENMIGKLFMTETTCEKFSDADEDVEYFKSFEMADILEFWAEDPNNFSDQLKSAFETYCQYKESL